MSLLKTFLTVALFLLNDQINAQDEFQSSCPRFFGYEGKKNESDKWYGNVTLLSDMDISDIWLRLKFDGPSLLLGNWFGKVVTMDNKEYLIQKHKFHLKAHVPHTVKFYLKYNPKEPVPKLVSLRLNGRTVCPEGLSTEAPPTTIQLEMRNVFLADNVTTVKPAGGGGESRSSKGIWLQGSSVSDEDEFYPGDFNLFENRSNQQMSINTTNVSSICGTAVGYPCQPECMQHSDCPPEKPGCFNNSCKNPCDGICGLNANCEFKNGTTLICSCPINMTGNPLEMCRPLTKEDLCEPNPCGANAKCRPGYDRFNKQIPVCSCHSGYIGDPLTGCVRVECVNDNECPDHQACLEYKCQNPCPGQCGVNSMCSPRRHIAICTFEWISGKNFQPLSSN